MHDEERQPKLFTLTEAEHTRSEVEPLLLEAMECRKKMTELDAKLANLATRISLAGGLLVSYDRIAPVRLERDKTVEQLKAALEQIESTGCVVKDLEIGLLDFPARLNNEDVFFCWRLGEDRIRFYHRQDEGFAGRKPLDPLDRGPEPIQ
jgi:hypothetical protein